MPTRNYIAKAVGALRLRHWAWLGVVVAGLAVTGALTFQQPTGEAAFYRHWGIDPHNPPYRADVDPRDSIEMAKQRAAENGKMVMVTFGANWCPDCLTLQKNLRVPETRAYAERKFEMVHVDVGDQAKTARVERELGLSVKGIPLAVFYSSDGRPICDTRHGQLEPSRHYSSREILGFLREVVDYRRAVSPDQRQ